MRNFIVLDTEGVNANPNGDMRTMAQTSLCYDVGFIVVDGNTLQPLLRESFVNVDVMFKEWDLMKTAYYANKLPDYYENMGGAGCVWELANTREIWERLKDACKQYNVKSIWAYNCRYDRLALNNTITKASNGFRKHFMPYGVKCRDIWDYAGSTICNTKKYVKWCMENNYLTANGNPQTSAEIVYRYITGEQEFQEEHTALSDCEIELAILIKARKLHRKARKSCGQGWRDAASIAKALQKSMSE